MLRPNIKSLVPPHSSTHKWTNARFISGNDNILFYNPTTNNDNFYGTCGQSTGLFKASAALFWSMTRFPSQGIFDFIEPFAADRHWCLHHSSPTIYRERQDKMKPTKGISTQECYFDICGINSPAGACQLPWVNKVRSITFATYIGQTQSTTHVPSHRPRHHL